VVVEVEHEGAQQELGVVVDAVSEVLEIPASEVEPAPNFGTRIRADFIGGMGKIGGRFVILLNMDRVLAVREMVMLSELAAASATDPDRSWDASIVN
jgi:purine-binding chemotaxis protein CheW